MKVAVVAPAATVTDAGTVAEALFDARVTTWPPAGAGPASLTVPVEGLPPMTAVGARVTVPAPAVVIARVAVLLPPFAAAVIVAEVAEATPVVFTVNVAVLAPAATVTVAGTEAAATLEVRFTTTPPAGAMEAMVTVPVEAVPPTTEVGATTKSETWGPVIVKFAEPAFPFAVAVIFAVLAAPTATVLTVKVAVVAPAATVAVAGTVADVLSEARFTTRPPAGAALVRVTVAVDGDPPTTLVGLRATAVTPGAVIARSAEAVFAPCVAVILAV